LSGLDVRRWVADELGEIRQRLENQVLAIVPAERRFEQPGGGNSIGYGLWHVAVHADFALHGVLQGKEPMLAAGGLPPGCGLAEAEDPLVATLDPSVIVCSLGDVLTETARWLVDADLSDLDRVVDSRAALAGAGVPEDSYGWLYRMWEGKPAAYFVRWELIGHVGNHVGEMIATRNRMGLSPF
jgi:hypothetical protein